MKRLLFALVALLAAAGASAWPPPSFPQCGPLHPCSEACYEPATEKCAAWVSDRIDGGAAACGVAGACEAD